MNRINKSNLKIDSTLYQFISETLLPSIGKTSKEQQQQFWQGFGNIVEEFTPRNRKLLAKREDLQAQIDDWHQQHHSLQKSEEYAKEYENFLRRIGYLVETPEAFEISTNNIDQEIAQKAGPQLVITALNARFALNALNARWGSLYDALYGTNAIEQQDSQNQTTGYDEKRGQKVIEWGREFLDRVIPLATGSHKDVTKYSIESGNLTAQIDGQSVQLRSPEVYAGFRGDKSQPDAILIINNGLYFEIQIDPNSQIGKQDKAGVKDILMESALTTIIDFEDSTAAVDAEDKTLGYSNWLGLNTGELAVDISKNGKTFTRQPNEDRYYTDVKGNELRLHGRSLMFVRNVGPLMQNPAILDQNGDEIFEGIMDGVITAAAAIPGLDSKNPLRNSRTGSIYIVKPKLHGPDEVQFTCDLFSAIEYLLGLPQLTLKIGCMDEERRTSLNLDACIATGRDRVAFINTGFLDRTGDEIHTSMYAGPMLRKTELQTAPWKLAYENNNVDAGLVHGFQGRAQIGKGMWTKTEQMAQMLDKKIDQLKEGASTAWVPSPTAATLHATHYHEVNIFEVQNRLLSNGRRNTFKDLMTIPLAHLSAEQTSATDEVLWSNDEIQQELNDNCQSILGYVVRWVEQGIGCSKVPDIHDIDLMEDRATLRISSQLLANWLQHEVISKQQVVDTLQRMALKVDKQNAGDSAYRNMAPDFDNSMAFQCAKELILKGGEQPSGYTEPLLHKYRQEFKRKNV